MKLIICSCCFNIHFIDALSTNLFWKKCIKIYHWHWPYQPWLWLSRSKSRRYTHTDAAFDYIWLLFVGALVKLLLFTSVFIYTPRSPGHHETTYLSWHHVPAILSCLWSRHATITRAWRRSTPPARASPSATEEHLPSFGALSLSLFTAVCSGSGRCWVPLMCVSARLFCFFPFSESHSYVLVVWF